MIEFALVVVACLLPNFTECNELYTGVYKDPQECAAAGNVRIREPLPNTEEYVNKELWTKFWICHPFIEGEA